MKPAFTLLHGLGYTKVRVVEIPSSFLKDWARKRTPRRRRHRRRNADSIKWTGKRTASA